MESSLQYIGKEDITIRHQTPLVSISAYKGVHRLSGGYVYRTLDSNYIYYQPAFEIEDVDFFWINIIYFQVYYQLNGENKVFTFEEKLNFDV